MCVSAVYLLSTFPSPVKKILQAYFTQEGFKPTTLAILEQCLTNKQINDSLYKMNVFDKNKLRRPLSINKLHLPGAPK